ncbi:FGGY-family carbohydrate kinase [Lactobacillus panisapium]|uniref:FGGY-family carbohydrate kinase n=1 Tax=Lactobacillus panisapium TaxID=2012495 RepID=UPI0022E63D52|nr:FGGY family carbohydrate kinase [Lactobacillus panisapium]
MTEKYLLAIDQSTQGTKALLIDQRNQVFWKTILTHKQISNHPDWISHDLAEIKANLFLLFKKALQQIKPEQLLGLAITNQRESAAAWSRKTGNPLCQTIVWQDNRASSVVKSIANLELQREVKALTGLALSPYFTGAKWNWMLINEPKVAQAAKNNDLCLGTMDSWLIYQLTNGQSFKTEPSNACRTQLMNIHTGSWDKKLAQIFKIDLSYLPEIISSNGSFGETDLFGLLPFQIPILSVLGDSQAALFAHGCFLPGDYKITFGTGSSIMLNIGNHLPQNIQNKLNTSIAWSLNGKTTYVLEGNINYAGASISWLKDKLDLIKTPAETSNLALNADSEDHTILIPAFAGLGAPYWKNDISAAFVGMKITTSKNELVRATLNSLVYQITDVLKEFKTLYPNVNHVIHVDGGMIHNKYLMQYLSDITQKKVKVATISELSALGTAMNAMKHTKAADFNQVYIPKMKAELADSYLQEWHHWLSKLD